jgi:nitroreductase
MMQSRLYSPTYAGPGRWIIFNPRARSAFLAVGGARQDVRSGNELFSGMAHQDVLPPVVEILRTASAAAGMVDDGDAQFVRLKQAGLLSDTPTEGFPSYLARYQLAVFDYPFNDYSDPEWLEKDVARMQQYARLWPPPALDTDRTGRHVVLPEPPPLELGGTVSVAGMSLDCLAYVLRYTFGAIGTVRFKFGDFHHKTSPSGGARHPAEGVVVLRDSLGDVSAGVYHYLPAEHALVAAPELGWLAASAVAPVEICFRLHVERAMFRYREIRSWRPVLIDIGHATEAACLLAGAWGAHSERAFLPAPPDRELRTLADPIIATVRLGTERRRADTAPVTAAGGDPAVLSNPLAYLTFEGEELYVHALHPDRMSTRITLREFEMLSYCIPSTRGDRPTTPEILAQRFPEVSHDRRAELTQRGVLLPSAEGAVAYQQAVLWSRYGWYPSLLAHLETRSALRNSAITPQAARIASIEGLSAAETTAALASRRTCRSFAPKPIQQGDFSFIAQTLMSGPQDDRLGLRAVANDVEGLASGATGRVISGILHDSGVRLSREDVRHMVIGQFPASAGAVTFWLTCKADLTAPERYEEAIVELGVRAQRMMIAATHLGLGVFCTPAINDKISFDRLGISGCGPETITYVLAVGFRNEDRS